MRRNFALEDEEVEAGFVLTCQTLPVSDEVTVDYDA
jgi:ring-1,2-phenylacetyl-CoA epoxidase subunit PaaE